jgi:hypothetical protein
MDFGKTKVNTNEVVDRLKNFQLDSMMIALSILETFADNDCKPRSQLSPLSHPSNGYQQS